MSRSNYNDSLYKMYEDEVNKNTILAKENKNLKLENDCLKYDLKIANNKITLEVEKATTPLVNKINNLENDLSNALNEIDRLKQQINKDNNTCNDDKDYLIDKLNNSLNKDSTNSSIPTSKESINNNIKRRTNEYNHRKASDTKTGGQPNHKGITLTKRNLEKKIEKNNIEVREIVHYIKGKENEEDIIKYNVGIENKVYIEKHIFIKKCDAKDKLPKEFYSDVTYKNDVKTLVVALGNYFSVPYNKVKEFIYDLSDGIIDISEGTIDNIYNKFDEMLDETLNNITTNLLNGTYQHTDETVTKENGKDTYYRGYANCKNVLYKYHHHKGDKPIEEDGILTNYYGTIISDHDTGIFKYGTNNQDCIIHFGRYCIEKEQNIGNIFWPMDLYRLLLKFERNRKIVSKFGGDKFSSEEIEVMEKEYDDILEIAEEENKKISSTYWKEKTETLLKRCIKYKRTMLFYIYDFSVPYDNNSIERALRMVKGKTKVSGGFRSDNGGKRFGRIMSVIKTAKLRKLKPFECIQSIYDGKVLFA